VQVIVKDGRFALLNGRFFRAAMSICNLYTLESALGKVGDRAGPLANALDALTSLARNNF